MGAISDTGSIHNYSKYWPYIECFFFKARIRHVLGLQEKKP